jgi:hypothetical protein
VESLPIFFLGKNNACDPPLRGFHFQAVLAYYHKDIRLAAAGLNDPSPQLFSDGGGIFPGSGGIRVCPNARWCNE